MISRINLYKVPKALGFLTLASLLFAGNYAQATIAQPEVVTLQADTVSETREILERASNIAVQSIITLQQLQSVSANNPTAEMLKNYMASMVYLPHPAKLPSDMEALDEPGLSTDNPDGMVVPHLDDEDSAQDKDLDLPIAKVNKQFLKLLNPVHNAFISSPFGFRWGRPHQGIDMAAPMGAPVMSAEAGKVVYSGWKSGYGNFIAVDHGHGYITHYAHCSLLIAHLGQRVQKGQLIAKVGSTGNSTGPHLHFEVVANGIHRNPVKFLNQKLDVISAHR